MNGSQNKFSFRKINLFIGDILVFPTALFLTLLIRGRNPLADFFYFTSGFLIIYIIWFLIIFLLNLYDIYFLKSFPDFIINLSIFSLFAFFIGAAYFYFNPGLDMRPKTILILNILIFDLIFIIWRYVFNKILELKHFKEKLVVIGFNSILENILPYLEEKYQIVFFLEEETYQRRSDDFKNFQVFYNIDDLSHLVTDKKIKSVVYVSTDKKFSRELFDKLPLRINYIDFRDVYESIAKKIPISEIDERWFIENNLKNNNNLEQVTKRVLDLLLASIGFIVFILLFPIISILIKLESGGPIFYKRRRIGLDGKPFNFYKFSSMVGNDNCKNDMNIWRSKDENQITKVGRILRKTHLDELPQIWNVFKGDLSFVGPRPEWEEIAKILEREIPFYKQRYLVKPGLFGWAQINFPASKSINETKEKFEYDLYYVKNHSLLLDIEIILKSMKLFLF